MTHRTFRLTTAPVLLTAAIAFSLSLSAAAAVEPEEEEERQERSEQRRSSGASTDLGSYRVGAPGSGGLRGIERRSGERERPSVDRESLRLDRSDFALEPAFGSSGNAPLEMDIRPSRDDRSDRRVVDEAPGASRTPAASTDVQNRELQPVLIEAPRYPGQAYRNRIEGFAIVEFTVGTDGKTRNVRVLESSPGTVFDNSAQRAVERWEFQPRIVNGRAVETTLTETIDFTID
ncbi:energy transducer TonB [Natronospira bacteriovora]|uniref:Protein TonB n=1 Tax=Natronospira bacteriovora TaxID=3069753 RepID=A0ABU0WD60_9GAMM|nr:energy transducer TonB [Natronospira sp. AB-CW4]MDQ2070860.1 energy transducer TonB [Natronospira sp. AB-CW4]